MCPCGFGLPGREVLISGKILQLAKKRTEAYALYCRAQSIIDDALGKFQSMGNPDIFIVVQDLEGLYNDCRSSICIEHALATIEEHRALKKLSKRVSSLSLNNGAASKREQENPLLGNLDIYKAAAVSMSDAYPLSLQSVPCKPYSMDLALRAIEFPSLDKRVKKEEKTLLSKLLRW